MKRLVRILALLALLVPASLFAGAAPVAAADCSKGAVYLYEHHDRGGIYARMCYPQTDADFGNGLNGVAGYLTSNWHDRLSSFRVTGDGTVGVCLYRNENYSSRWHQSKANQPLVNIDIFNNDETDSLRWGPISPLNNRAAC